MAQLNSQKRIHYALTIKKVVRIGSRKQNSTKFSDMQNANQKFLLILIVTSFPLLLEEGQVRIKNVVVAVAVAVFASDPTVVVTEVAVVAVVTVVFDVVTGVTVVVTDVPVVVTGVPVVLDVVEMLML